MNYLLLKSKIYSIYCARMKKNKLKTLIRSVAVALEITETRKADLARAIDVQPQTIQHLCHGNVKFTIHI